MTTYRKNSVAFGGGAYGDEGKGRLVDKYVSDFAKKGPVIVYRDNGGANAGHTVELANGKRVAFHQLPSGVFSKGATVVLGKTMVIHPGDLIEEISQLTGTGLESKIIIDEMAVLSLDTHRAYESVLKGWHEGGKASTGRGISPAYADVLLRQPLRMRDLISFDRKKISTHYRIYQAWIKGMGKNLKDVAVVTLGKKGKIVVGTEAEFMRRLKKQARILKQYTASVYDFIKKSWNDKTYSFVFEKAMAVGIDPRWGVYPDITASDCTFAGIFGSTEGIIDPEHIPFRANVIKATYMSSVGTRILPTKMEGKLATRIREDAHEYGATTGRPRDIAYLDIPAMRFFATVGRANYLVLTHMDVAYADVPIKVCVRYEIKGKEVSYRPDQQYLLRVKPVYITLKSWKKDAIRKAKKPSDLPPEAKKFLRFIEKEMGLPVLAITTGAEREQAVFF